MQPVLSPHTDLAKSNPQAYGEPKTLKFGAEIVWVYGQSDGTFVFSSTFSSVETASDKFVS
jgi:hypothetical protein